MSRPPSSIKAELSRKGIHLATSIFPLAYAVGDHKRVMLAILGVLLVLLAIAEIARRRPVWLGRLFNRVFGYMLRDHEKSRGLLGSTWYCLASLLCIAFLTRPVAVLALLYLAYGDTAASLVGRRWGRTRIGAKSLEGTLGFMAVACLAAAVARACSPEYSLTVGLIGALAAALAELLLTRLDDNLSVPLVAGVAMTLAARLMG
ncbi:MAG: SEC59/DGK1/VTE5 family protein [bacterium]|nr:SEC59/DGK1/VTE5 family protein [bacterium]